MNILIVGEAGVGKSSLINKLLMPVNAPIYGFITEKIVYDNMGDSKVYINPAKGKKTYSNDNVIGVCKPKSAKANPQAFECWGVQLLSGIPKGSVILMDELGFMESEAPIFCSYELNILNGSNYVIAGVKHLNTSFLNAVRSCKNALLYNVTVDNRNILYEQILSDIKRLDPTSPFVWHNTK